MTNTEERLRVFISSTFLDLQPHRQAVFNAILAMDNTTEDMIYWSADERQPTTVSLDRVRESDIVILVIAHRYGYVPDGALHSVTEQEYNAARSFGIPVLSFLLDESVPWPPSYIEWEKRDQLAAFKNRLKSDAVIRTFSTPDQLSALVSQALSGFQRRHRERDLPRTVLKNLIRLDPSSSLNTRPDLTIQIGTSEDDLPLLLSIRRSRDFSAEFNPLESALTRPSLDPPVALLSSFKQSLEQYATQAWANDGIETVRMKDGGAERLFVARSPLAHFFDSAVDALLGEGACINNVSVMRRDVSAVRRATAITALPNLPSRRPPTAQALPNYLQSEGGANRFLGVSIKDGSVYSIGRPRDIFGRDGEGWTEWRPFIHESIPSHFPNAAFVISYSGDTKRVTSSRYEQTLRGAMSSAIEDRARPTVVIELSRASLGAFVVRLAEAVSEWHKRGAVHGDLKPSNVLLSANAITLIDDFQLSEGQVAPGWTPGWSAPEQVIGGQVSYASDVYPFGRMIACLLEGNLVGEVRKFKVSTSSREMKVTQNPKMRQPES